MKGNIAGFNYSNFDFVKSIVLTFPDMEENNSQ